MSENLYAPPQAELGSGAERATGTGDFDLGRCLSDAWTHTWRNFPLWLGAGIVFLLACLVSALFIVPILLVIPVLYWGSYAFTLKMHDGGAAVGDLFSGFSRYGAALAGMWAYFILSILLSVPGGVISQIGQTSSPPQLGWVGLGNAVAIGIVLFVTSRLNFVPFLMVDRGLSFGEAISLAWARTSQLKGKLALLTIAMMAVAFAGVIALLVGVIPAMVVGFLMWASAYRQIFGSALPAAA